ncbi:hypothetical protein [uncultured Succinatimonas sp.]|uniref:hypothetical protein n=1 Tax=uncultured Succinatimonas sp. TaxID=1262973 RepID=UPI0025ED5C85|nr:hypothetical protein [uncultured Succinatimonas sp.]
MADLSVNFSDVKQNSDELSASLHTAVKRYSLALAADFFDNTETASDFSVLYRALIGNSDEILTIVEDCLGPECFEKRADKVIEERLLTLKEKLSGNDFYLYRQCLLTAFAGLGQNINSALKNKIALNLKVNADLPENDLKDLLVFLLGFIKDPVKKSKLPIPDFKANESTQEPLIKEEQESNAENDEIIMSKIRNLLSEAAEKAKAANLVPKDTNTALHSHKIKKTETQSVKPLQEKSIKEDTDLLLDNDEKQDENVSFGELSLKDLARRAAKLQEEFRNERIKLAKEGKLPNPAKLPQNFPPKIKKDDTVHNTELTSPLELFEERNNKARVNKEASALKEETLKTARVIDNDSLMQIPEKEEDSKAQKTVPNLAENIQEKANNLNQDENTERFIASFDNENTKTKQNSDFKETIEDDFKPVTFYHDAKVVQEIQVAKTHEIKPKQHEKTKVSWLKRIFNYLFKRHEDTVLLPYSIEKRPSASFIDADTLPQSLREKILKEQDLNEFKHFLTEQLISHNLPQSLEKLIDDFLKSFYELQQNPQYEDDFIAFIKAPLSSQLNVSDKFNSLLFVLLILEADRQGYDIAYLFVGHPQIKERYDAVFSDKEYDSLTLERQKAASFILTALLSEIYRLQNYCLDNEGSLRALITENPCAKEESSLLIDVEENVMGHTVRIRSFVPHDKNQGILVKCCDDKRVLRLNLICSNLPLLKKAQTLKEKLKPAFEYLGYEDPQIHIRLGSNLKVFLNKQPFFKDGLICLRDETAADPVLRHKLQLNQYELIECLLKLLRDLNLCQCDKLGTSLNEDDLNLKLRPILAVRHLILKLSGN